jgi:predicted SprT family Zn-dependent metalloprotease
MAGHSDFFGQLLRGLQRQATSAVRKERTRGGGDEVLTARCAALLAPLECPELRRRVEVRWSGRLRSTAGIAYPALGIVALNPRLREFGEAEIDRTLRHELAHLLAHFRAGRRRIAPHGPEWRRACHDLGLVGEPRCHDLPLPRKKLERRHLYRCKACGAEIRRVKPLRRASACLACCRKHNRGRYDERFRLVKTGI